ncbi:cap-specific mRNA (nucleoside-2'-O-)-methyltransferase 2 [Megalobrama amblycephala]|uniref:cap-specific mRNA (nucleoside-2'-O-)-methyltransferase 2 n=1 Tax=Megalobrama amblycephala TaxID=75352 RepID=UPI0020143799|nr:cap-specific mRNA (nucleoside-2'-O-)-methyltransferase 2 [Megalobrama amblycephala]XP_048039890.1 cap-specific mRNA (nucleoside-2'-O-)-methyltransferase 2 [Megalobrama amblycephala]XP_048039892.1 cap-specific mRNA (nucleoside-2'-O-)-methyltransferase 2 [Megalobrama amblycephala]XP_048039893.1 cap-specific mRNA (nucleoside-2'-O-)-methyltransferase 2 [Megalobrama amblycephala]XP_048039894.1 cap-specific mRNA (nucleoside-2'-O-)-methyltransferase 2 [Megalobrama amblycephala]
MNRGRGVRKRTAPEKSNALETCDEEICAELHHLFNKVRGYVPPAGGEWKLPDPSVVLCDPHASHPRLQALKRSLNEVKNQLSDKDLSVWHQHTCFTNRAGTVTAHLRSTTNAELCTQAWAKFYEILGTFNLLPDNALKSGELNSIHLCEAPGAFISALNHFLKTSGLHCDWSWIANTLNPYYEANGRGCTITDDRLIAHTLPWWFFGSDNTGDIMLQKHLLELPRFVSNMRCVDLVTADGSFDCQGDPGEQERLVAPLQYCEAVCALLLLGTGGSFVLKMFTLFEHSSVCLLYLLACCFRSVNIFKPGTSKSGNSELYIVCLDYQAKEQIRPLLSKLIRNYGPDLSTTVALFPRRCIPDSFLSQHEEICAFFHALQVNTIQENLKLFVGMSVEQRRRLEQLREYAAEFYTKRFNVHYLPRKSWVCRGGVARWVKHCERKQMGSFNQRKEMELQGWKQRLAQGNYGALIEKHLAGTEGCEIVLSGPLDECDLGTWFALEGAALPKVCSSTFCDQEMLDFLNEALEENLRVKAVNHSDRAVPMCNSCRTDSPVSILSEICSHPDVTSCLVLRSRSWCDGTLVGVKFQPEFLQGPSCCEVQDSTLHDGQPDYQLELLNAVLYALQNQRLGSALVIPLCSALTRFTSGLVFTLHLCFRYITFRSLSGWPHAALVCMGFSPPSVLPRLLDFLRDVMENMKKVKLELGRQVLQFVPLEELLRGELPRFLSSFNTAVIRQQLHVLMQVEYGT